MGCRIAYVVGQLVAGGLERQLSYLLSGLDRERYQPEVFVWNFDEREPFVAPIRSLGVPLHPVGGASPLEKTLSLRGAMRVLQPELAHSFSTFTNFSTWVATRGLSTIPVGSIRSAFELTQTSTGWRGLLNARYPRRQIFNSHAAAVSAKQFRGFFRPQEALVVCNGMDVHAFRPVEEPAAETPLLLGIGSLRQVKRWDRMLNVCARLRDEAQAFHFRLVGEGPLREKLQQQVSALGLEKAVTFLGHRSDIGELLADSSVLVLTSEIEGTPNVVMEAMACGRPVVAMECGDVSRIVQHGETGFVCPNGDEAQFATYLCQLLGDRELRGRMGSRGREVAEREFGLDRLVANMLDAYRQAGWQG